MSDPKRRAPAFLLYVDDFLAGTSDMSCEEVGAYIRLLCHQWTKGSIPNDEQRATRIAGLMGSPSLRYVLAKFALCEDGNRRNIRLETVRTERDKFLLQQAENGRKGAEKRWGNGDPNGNPNGDPNGKPIATPLATPMANACPKDSSPSPIPIPSPIPLNPLTPLQGEVVVLPQGEKETPPATTTPLEQEKPQGDGNPPKGKRSRKRVEPMQIPTLDEIKLHAAKIGLPETEAYKFHGYYESNGWRVGKNPMKSWVGAMTTWKGSFDERRFAPTNNGQPRLFGTSTPDDSGF